MRADALRAARIAQVGEDEIFERDWLHVPGRIEDRLAGAHEEHALLVGVALLDDLLIRRQRARVAAWSGQPPSRSTRLRHPPAHPHLRPLQNNQVAHTTLL